MVRRKYSFRVARPVSKALSISSWRSSKSDHSRWNFSTAARREVRSQPLVRITPPLSQNKALTSVMVSSKRGLPQAGGLGAGRRDYYRCEGPGAEAESWAGGKAGK